MTDTAVETQSASQRFIGRLDDLVRRGDRARLASLRQLVTPQDRWGPHVFATAYPLMPPNLDPNEESKWMLVAGLYAQWHQGKGTPASHTGSNLGTSMHTFALGVSGGDGIAPSVERRFSVLLSSDDERLAHHLRQAVSQLSSGGTNVDFICLLNDLRQWDHPDHFVQRNWARSFWVSSTNLSDGKE
ncbi:MAG: type I-E CRISPR-associated protein Cse2/CasB [Acidimicrobiales bacterium]